MNITDKVRRAHEVIDGVAGKRIVDDLEKRKMGEIEDSGFLAESDIKRYKRTMKPGRDF